MSDGFIGLEAVQLGCTQLSVGNDNVGSMLVAGTITYKWKTVECEYIKVVEYVPLSPPYEYVVPTYVRGTLLRVPRFPLR